MVLVQSIYITIFALIYLHPYTRVYPVYPVYYLPAGMRRVLPYTTVPSIQYTLHIYSYLYPGILHYTVYYT